MLSFGRIKVILVSVLMLFLSLYLSVEKQLTAAIVSNDVASQPIATNGTAAEDASGAVEANSLISLSPKVKLSAASWELVQSSDQGDIDEFNRIFNAEWAKYPESVLDTSGLKKVYLVKNLTVDGQTRAAMPEPISEDALYFDISKHYLSSENGDYIRRVIHHEFAHLIIYNIHGDYQGDSAWSRCNTSNISYGSGGASMYQNPEYAHAIHPVEGFINGYATSGIEEDRAEVFAYLMVEGSQLDSLSADDEKLSCKVELTKQLVRSL
jgi:Putative zinc-binding metallo-peptidase